MNAPLSPLDDIRALLDRVGPPPGDAAARTATREAQLLKPPGSLGRMEEIAHWLSAWQNRSPPQVLRPLIAIYASSHGVTRQGVSAYPAEVNGAMLAAYGKGQGAINAMAEHLGAGLKVFDLGVEAPTPDITEAPAMSARVCAGTMAFGMEALASEPDLLLLGEMGIGNTTIAAALCAALFGGSGADWAGPGTGIDASTLAHKQRVIDRALERHRSLLTGPLECLCAVGGREFAAIAGAILGARLQGVPVLLDGFAVTAAAAVLHQLRPDALDHCMVAHQSAEPGHARLLAALKLRPLLNLDMRLGEATGSGAALSLVKLAVAVHAGMATFAEAGLELPS